MHFPCQNLRPVASIHINILAQSMDNKCPNTEYFGGLAKTSLNTIF